MITRDRFDYLYGRLMTELGVDPDDPRRIEQCARWYERFKESSDQVCEMAFADLPKMMDPKQRTPGLPQMFDAVRIARAKVMQARAGEHAGEWCSLCAQSGCVMLVRLPTGWWPYESVGGGSPVAFACPCGNGMRNRVHMRIYHDGLLAPRAPRPPRQERPAAPSPDREGKPIGPAVLAALARVRRGEGPREVIMKEEFEKHGIPWVE